MKGHIHNDDYILNIILVLDVERSTDTYRYIFLSLLKFSFLTFLTGLCCFILMLKSMVCYSLGFASPERFWATVIALD